MRHRSIIGISALFIFIVGICTPKVGLGQAFVNGSFEADNWLNGADFKPDVDGTNGPITGWSAFDNGLDPDYLIGVNNASMFGNTPHGHQYLVLGALGRGGNSVSQTITGLQATPAIPTVYDLHFSQSSGVEDSILEILTNDGLFPEDLLAVGPPMSSQPWDTWADYTVPVIATGPTITLTFRDFGDDIVCVPACGASNDVGLDDIYLTGPGISNAAPEPGALPLLLAGLGVPVAAFIRRRHK